MAHSTTVLGTISGSSLDGLDLALCRFTKTADQQLTWAVEGADTLAYTDEWQLRLAEAPGLSGLELTRLDANYSYLTAELCKDFFRKKEVDSQYIAVHGHTVFHGPDEGYTLQIGNGGYISSATERTVISDFRTQDIGLGGQGAPIAPIVEKILFPGHNFYLNLGGICNLTSVSGDEHIAYDVCGCNQMLNGLASLRGLNYDKDGSIAANGDLNSEVLALLDAPAYYQKAWPKSLDNSWVKSNLTNKLLNLDEVSVEDRMFTTCHHITQQISAAVRKHLQKSGVILRTMFATGGGVLNAFLIDMLSRELERLGVQVVIPDRQIIEFKEAILMALMGYLRLENTVNTIPSVTGAREAAVAGAIYHYNTKPLG